MLRVVARGRPTSRFLKVQAILPGHNLCRFTYTSCFLLLALIMSPVLFRTQPPQICAVAAAGGHRAGRKSRTWAGKHHHWGSEAHNETDAPAEQSALPRLATNGRTTFDVWIGPPKASPQVRGDYLGILAVDVVLPCSYVHPHR
jgi:hypothetical protein